MNEKQFTIAILGCGSRGCEAYGRLFMKQPERYKIVSLCDADGVKTEKYGKIFGVKNEELFTDPQEFLKEKRAEVLVIATCDDTHVEFCLKALELGYDILLEKPISDKKEELDALMEAKKKAGKKVIVCHVLRYSPPFMKIGEIVKSGAIGQVISINILERVGYFHIAQSYVRGNWRNTTVAAPLVLAKCCHDTDLMQSYVGSKAKSVISIGDLTYFKKENKPEGAADRCLQCKYADSCPYSAKTIYIKHWHDEGEKENSWPYNVITPAIPLTEEAITEALDKGPYGRCVFACDNNVVDHQNVIIQFENGVIGTLDISGFTNCIGRRITVHGTKGDVELDQNKGYIELVPFGEKTITYDVGELIKDAAAIGNQTHGGGDYGLINNFYDMLVKEGDGETGLAESLESHYMCLAAEESRLNGGKVVKVH